MTGLTCLPNHFSLCCLIALTVLGEIQTPFKWFTKSYLVWATTMPTTWCSPCSSPLCTQSSSCATTPGRSISLKCLPYSNVNSTPRLKHYVLQKLLLTSHSLLPSFNLPLIAFISMCILQFLMWLFVDYVCSFQAPCCSFSVSTAFQLEGLMVFRRTSHLCTVCQSGNAMMTMPSKQPPNLWAQQPLYPACRSG